jgi:hypothetical protein
MAIISNLPALATATISGSVIFPVVAGTSTNKASFNQLKDYFISTAPVQTVAGRTGNIVLTYTDVSGLSNVAHSGDFADLVGKPNTYPVTTSTASTLGGVKVGNNLYIVDGKLSATTGTYVSASAPGAVATGTFWWNSVDGSLYIKYENAWVDAVAQETYTLPVATTSTLGGVKIGAGLIAQTDGTLSVNAQTSVLSAQILELNSQETSDHISSTGTFAGTSGLFIKRGTGASSDPALFLFNDNLTYSDGTTSTRGMFTFSKNTSSAAIVISGIRVSTGTTELNIFGSNNPFAVISVKGTSNYQDQVTRDYHIPNKQYVDNKFATVASTTTVGTVQIGSGININNSGTISVTQYSLNTATGSVLGGVKIGTGILITADGIISATTATPYTLTTATSSVLGGVKIGSGVQVAGDGTISVNTGSTYNLPTATTSTLGGVKVDGSTITINGSGVISAAGAGTFVGGTIAGATQFTNSTQSTSTTTGAVTIAGGLGVSKSVNVAGTMTALAFVTNGASGTPRVYSASNLNLEAVGRVQVTQSPFKVWNVSTSTRDTIAASNGDMIYNTDANKFQGYANGTWVDLN